VLPSEQPSTGRLAASLSLASADSDDVSEPPRYAFACSEPDKDKWARELEITRAELDEMSPSDFGKAWDERNERLRDGGVFEYVTELRDAHGWKVIEKMTPSELISAVADLGLTPSVGAQSSPMARRRTRDLLAGD
jgi:hypothetical protein